MMALKGTTGAQAVQKRRVTVPVGTGMPVEMNKVEMQVLIVRSESENLLDRGEAL